MFSLQLSLFTMPESSVMLDNTVNFIVINPTLKLICPKSILGLVIQPKFI